MSEYIITCDEETASWIGNDVDSIQPLVRCMECAKWHPCNIKDGLLYGECDKWKRRDSYCVPTTHANGFCAWGERKEDGDD